MSNQWQQFLAVRAEIEGRTREPEEGRDEALERIQEEAYAEGRKDEREASCVDELVAALKEFVSPFDGESEYEIQDGYGHGTAERVVRGRAILAKLEQKT